MSITDALPAAPLAVLVAFFSAAAPLPAQQSPWDFQAEVRLGHGFHLNEMHGGGDFRFASAMFWGVGASVWRNRTWGLRLYGDRATSRVSGDGIFRSFLTGDDRIGTLQIQVLRAFRRGERLRPHVGLGVGLREYRVHEHFPFGGGTAPLPRRRQVRGAASALLGASLEGRGLRLRVELESIVSQVRWALDEHAESPVRWQVDLRPSLTLGIPIPGTAPTGR